MFKLFNRNKEIDNIKYSIYKLICNTDDVKEVCKLVNIYEAIDNVYKGDTNAI